MTQLIFSNLRIWTISEITIYIRELLETDDNLHEIWVQGEISNLAKPSSGHLYFSLKDERSSLRCVMWQSSVIRQQYIPIDGESVEVLGSIGVYERSGQYQFYADIIRPLGEGLHYQEFLRLKAKLEIEGLFAEERKRAIPRWPKRIGVVTSSTGAALRDILNTINRRYRLAEVILSPTPVQGEDAPPGIVQALVILNQLVNPDMILVARGGGSIEDLWAFNDERVARAISDSPAPVITGIGHETDFTIADFVSDLRAATPTAAAEQATPDYEELQISLQQTNQRLINIMLTSVSNFRWDLNRLEQNLIIHSPTIQIRSDRQRIDDLQYRSINAISNLFRLKNTHMIGLDQRLISLNPLSILERGYSAITGADGNLVRSVHQVKTNDELNIQVVDGTFSAEVREIQKRNDQ